MNAKVLSEVLTPREHNVLEGILAGETNRTMGKRLGISHRTVEAHRSRMMGKLGVKNVIELSSLIFSADPTAHSRSTLKLLDFALGEINNRVQSVTVELDKVKRQLRDCQLQIISVEKHVRGA